MKELKHNDKVILNGRKGIVGTVRGFAQEYTGVSAKYNTDPEEAYKKALTKKEELFWINQEVTVICGDPGYYEQQKAAWLNAIPLTDKEVVTIEGEILSVHYKGNYSDMGALIQVK
jgi:hypothetical protein